MDLSPTDIQRELAGTACRWLAERWPASYLTELAAQAGSETGYDRGDWSALAGQGWLDDGLGVVELGLLAVESGYALQPTPWLVTMAVRPLYQAAGVSPPGPATLADGEAHGSGGPLGNWPDGACGGGLDGTVAALDADTAVVVPVCTQAGTLLAEVQLADHGVTVTRPEGLDLWRRPAIIRMDGAPARVLMLSSAAADPLAAARDRRDALLSCEATGVARRALDMAVSHARQRRQFGRPIGSYQAVGHALADSYAGLELARSLSYRALCVLAEGAAPDVRAEALATAAEASSQAAVTACETAIQVLGGMGVTWEYPLHLWYRRALWHRAARSGPADPLSMVGDLILGPAG